MPDSGNSWLFAYKAIAALGLGALGALIMAGFDPPKTRRMLFAQSAVAGGGSVLFGPVAVHFVDHMTPWIDIHALPLPQHMEWAAPIYFVVGALSWGAFGALAKFRRILRVRAADRLAKLMGMLKTIPGLLDDHKGK